MDIVQKMRLHSQVDSLLVDDTKSANIHAMIVFAESDCSKVRKELISSISEHVSRRIRNDSENIRTKAIKLAQILIQKGPKEFRLEVTKFSNEIVRSIVNDEGVNFGRRSFELGKELNEIMFSSGSSSSSSSSFRQTMTNKIVGISGANSDNSNDSNNNSNATIANNKKQQRDATRVGGVSSLTGIEHASGLFKFAGEVSKNVAMKVGNTVNEITKENPRHRDLIDEEYTKSEMSGGSLADSMNKTKMNAMTTTKGPWGREESAVETKPTTTATTSSSFQKDSVVGAPSSSSSSKDPLADLLGMMAAESVPSVTTNVSSSSKISSEVWTLKGTGPSRETKNEVHISPLPHQLTPLEGSEEQKRVDSLCGVAGIKLVPDEQELLKLFEHIERRGLEPSLVVQAFIAKIALAYSVEEEQLGWKASKKALLCVQKALERRDSILEKALKADDGNLLFVLRRTVDETNNNNNNIKETVKKTAREILKTYFENDDRNNNTSSSIFGGAAAATATATATTSNITNMLDSLNWS